MAQPFQYDAAGNRVHYPGFGDQQPAQGQPTAGNPPTAYGVSPPPGGPVYQPSPVQVMAMPGAGAASMQQSVNGQPPQVTIHQTPPNYGAATGTGMNPQNPGEGLIPKAEDRFPAKTQWVDVAWAVMFLLHTVGFIGVCSYCTYGFVQKVNNGEQIIPPVQTETTINGKTETTNHEWNLSDLWHMAGFVGTGIGVAVLVSFMFFSLAMRWAKQIIWSGLVLVGVLLLINTMLLVLVAGDMNGLYNLIPLALLVLFGFCCRNSIAMAGALIAAASKAVKANYGMKILALVAALFHGIFMTALFSMMFAAVLYCAANEDRTMMYGMWFWGIFTLIWISVTASNCLHCTYSGSCARFFYQGQERQDKNPTITAMKLAYTKYLGASSFGGFLIAFVAIVRALNESAKERAREKGNCFALILAMIVGCCLDALQELVNIVNQFAICYVAIYGNKFWTSGKMVFKLAESTRLEPIFNSAALSWFSWAISLYVATITGVVMYLLWHFSIFSLTALQLIVTLVMVVIFAMSLAGKMMRPLDSGARTLLIIFMEAPAYFQKSQPEAYNAVRDRAFKLKIVDQAPAHLGAVAPASAD